MKDQDNGIWLLLRRRQFSNFPYLIPLKPVLFKALILSCLAKTASTLLRFLFIGLGLTFCTLSQGQQNIEQNLLSNFNRASSDSERIISLGQLSAYYYANKDYVKGDSLIERQIMLAEASLKQHLVLAAYFGNAGYLSTGTVTKERSAFTANYIKRALEYARANDLTDYVALAYANMAQLNNSDGRMEEAFKNANLAFTTALNTRNDSAKVICAVQLGNIYHKRSDVLMAFKTYTNALNIAIVPGKETLLPPVYHALANLYNRLGQKETAKKYVNQSLAVNRKTGDKTGQINDNIFLAKLNNYTAGKEYLQEAVGLADSLHNLALKIESEKILFFHMLIQEKPATMLAFLESHPELTNVFVNTGPGYLDWMLAEVYLYGGQNPDSALIHLKKAEESFRSGYDVTTRKNFFSEYAYCYQQLKNTPMAIRYYQQLYDLSRAASDLRSLQSSTGELKNLYRQQGDYKQAFQYGELYDHYKDSVDLLGKERDFALLEIENETRQQQRDADLAKEQLRRKFNLQYMLITIVVATAFLLMIMIGMFRVSTFTIRLMGFLSLIFFFEFIILLLDTWIHHLTHGEPWKIWLIKIGIISLLLPIHHFLEHKLIRYLLSHHLITLRSKISPGRIFRKKKPLPDQVEREEASGDDPIF